MKKSIAVGKVFPAARRVAGKVLSKQTISRVAANVLQEMHPPFSRMPMLKWIGTIGAVALAATLYERRRAIVYGSRDSELETVAARELRKILIYTAAPTFLAPVSELHHDHPQRRWADRIAR
jgi:hypothetical protein